MVPQLSGTTYGSARGANGRIRARSVTGMNVVVSYAVGVKATAAQDAIMVASTRIGRGTQFSGLEFAL